MAMQIVDGDKLDRSLTATADRIREVTGESADIPFDYAGETGFAAAIPEGGGGGGTLRPLIATENRVYTPPAGVDGFNIVTVAVETPQYSPRCDQVSTFNWGFLQGYWGFDDVYPTDYPPAPPEPGPDPDPPAPSLYPQWATGTDAEIAALLDAAAAGSLDLQRDAGWAVGDVRTIPVSSFTSGETTNPAENIDIVITSFDEYKSCGNLLQFDFACGLSTKFRMNPTDTTEGGYGASEMYESLLPALSDALPSWLRMRLKLFRVNTKTAESGGTIRFVTVSGNKLALRSSTEVFGNPSLGDNDTQLAYYQNQIHRIKKTGLNGENADWWLRTVPTPGKFSQAAASDGSEKAESPSALDGVAPFGCLGGLTEHNSSSWSTGTDAEVAALIDAAQAGTIDLQQDAGWAVGDIRTIHVNAFTPYDNAPSPAQDIELVITSFDEYMSCGNKLQFDFRCALSMSFSMNDTDSNEGGYGSSRMYSTVMPAMVNALPEWIKTRLRTFSVLANTGGSAQSSILSVGNNKLALRSQREIFGDGPEEGGQLPYYESIAAKIKKSGLYGASTTWWLRTAYSSSHYRTVTGSGTLGFDPAKQTGFVRNPAPFGCL